MVARRQGLSAGMCVYEWFDSASTDSWRAVPSPCRHCLQSRDATRQKCLSLRACSLSITGPSHATCRGSAGSSLLARVAIVLPQQSAVSPGRFPQIQSVSQGAQGKQVALPKQDAKIEVIARRHTLVDASSPPCHSALDDFSFFVCVSEIHGGINFWKRCFKAWWQIVYWRRWYRRLRRVF